MSLSYPGASEPFPQISGGKCRPLHFHLSNFRANNQDFFYVNLLCALPKLEAVRMQSFHVGYTYSGITAVVQWWTVVTCPSSIARPPNLVYTHFGNGIVTAVVVRRIWHFIGVSVILEPECLAFHGAMRNSEWDVYKEDFEWPFIWKKHWVLELLNMW